MRRIADLPSFAGAPWLREPRLQAVMQAITAAGGEVRVAGGALRNAFLGEPIADIDLATTLLPEGVMRSAEAAGFGVHPTGIEHGTVTVVNHGLGFEITTLRRDVSTDGRRATVAFTGNWREDALRRDFTINAMFCDADGKVYDFTNGYGDIRKRRVRFVGLPSRRIKEDYLRILRFFRFYACYSKGAPDKAGLAACIRLRKGLASLSAERIRHELLKLLEAPRAVATLKVMAKAGILPFILPYTDEWRVIARLPPDGILRLFVLSAAPDGLQDLLRLSKTEAKRVQAMIEAPTLSPVLRPHERRRLLYVLGRQAWCDGVHLSWAESRAPLDDPVWLELLALPEQWTAPRFPVSGKDLVAARIAPGPAMGETLRELEDWWIASDFKPSRDELVARIKT